MFTWTLPDTYIACLILALSVLPPTSGKAQVVDWQDQIGHPQANPNGTFSYDDNVGSVAIFSEKFVAAVYGFNYTIMPPYNYIHRQGYIRYYDYDGRILNEDTVGGMVSSASLIKNSDSSFIVIANITYVPTGQFVFDTGQNGGYLIREYNANGNLLWQRRTRTNTRSYISGVYSRQNKGFVTRTSVNMDNRGLDSLGYEFYDANGNLDRLVIDPPIPLQGRIAFTQNPERILSVRVQAYGNPGPWLYTVVHLDSSLSVQREDTIGLLWRNYPNPSVIARPDDRYIVAIPQVSDTLRARLFFFDHPGRPSRSYLIDSGGIDGVVPLADGGTLSYESKLVSNSVSVLTTLANQGQPTLVGSYLRRRNSAWSMQWSLDVSSWSNDSISFILRPRASIPSSPDDAIFVGSRVVSSRVQSEPWGTFALVGRIDGVGTIFDPTAIKGPREPSSPWQATVYPNPATDKVFIHTQKPVTYRLLTTTGVLIRQGQLREGESLGTSELPPALYQLLLSDGRSVVVKRFVKE